MNQTFYGCASITTAERTQLISKQNVPGPGTYDPAKKDTRQIPNWTLKPKIEYTSCFYNGSDYVPAPGAYEVLQSEVNVEQWKKQGKAAGQRQIKLNTEKDRGFGERSSPILELHLPSFVDNRGGFSFGYRDPIVVTETSPGPIYHLAEKQQERRREKVMNKSTGFGFGDRGKQEGKQSAAPGPGQYSPKKMYQTAQNWSFAKSPRKQPVLYSNLIGPGEYDTYIKENPKKIYCRLKGKYSQPKLDHYNAAPGSYEIPTTITKRSAVFRGNSSTQFNQNSVDTPSPFSYNVAESTLKNGGYSLGKKLQTINVNVQNPGPGSYEVEQNIAEKVGGYMSRKIQLKSKPSDTQDNFYKYSPKDETTRYRFPQFTFKGTSPRVADQNSTLGPGSYNVLHRSSGQSYSMSKNARFKPIQKQKPHGELITRKQYYSSCGFLPSYLKNKKENKQPATKAVVVQKQKHKAKLVA